MASVHYMKGIAKTELKHLYVHFVECILCNILQVKSKIGGVCVVLSIEEVVISLESEV